MDILENLVTLLREHTEAGKTEIPIAEIATKICLPEIKKRNEELEQIKIK